MSRYFSPAPPRVLAHRGLAIDASGATVAPENTMLAFLTALEIGVTHIETDVHASLDGIAVISHDADLLRLAGRTERIKQLTLAELQRIDLGYGQTFSSLREVLAAFPNTRFNIDIKSADAVVPTVNAIRDAGAIERVLVTSFRERRRVAANRAVPGVATSASALRFAGALLCAELGLRPIVRFILRDIDAVQVPEIAMGLRVTTPRILRLLQSAKVEVHIWTVNDVASMSRLLDLGVDGLVTDRADLALSVLASRR